ncbi:MAG: LacI family DNA-binding transcriptional regulator [Chloroflexi bacterium]|nr:LacI family DNA-binding transcriptional regulator [Chloroflexota bacterium]
MAKQKVRKRSTQADIAQRAGVSQAMVSYVLNNAADISIPHETRQRIMGVAAELGYIPNNNARSLRTSKSFTIASIIPDITNPFYPDFQRGVQEVAEHNGYGLMIYNTDGDEEKEQQALRSALQTGADGIIGVFFHVNARNLRLLLELGVRIVRLEPAARSGGSYPLDSLFVDNVAAARAAVTYLIERGYRRIGLLTASAGPGASRMAGYRDALEAHGMAYDPRLVMEGDFMEESGYETMRRLLEQTPRPDAVFAVNDMMAIGALVAAREAGLAIPQDVAIMGFDDIPVARLVEPSLSTVTQFQRRLGQRAAAMLLERLASSAPQPGRCEEMPFSLILRQST